MTTSSSRYGKLTGAFLVNYAGCGQCGRRDGLAYSQKQVVDDDEEDLTVEYLHGG